MLKSHKISYFLISSTLLGSCSYRYQHGQILAFYITASRLLFRGCHVFSCILSVIVCYIWATPYSFDMLNLYGDSTRFCLSWFLTNLSLILDLVLLTNILFPYLTFLSATITMSHYYLYYLLQLVWEIYHTKPSPSSQITFDLFLGF